MSIIPTLVIEPKDLEPFIKAFREQLKEKRQIVITGIRPVERADGIYLYVDTFIFEPSTIKSLNNQTTRQP